MEEYRSRERPVALMEENPGTQAVPSTCLASDGIGKACEGTRRANRLLIFCGLEASKQQAQGGTKGILSG
jgi:hypothetical protein